MHTVFRSVQFRASFISFHFEILSYLACGEKIIKLRRVGIGCDGCARTGEKVRLERAKDELAKRKNAEYESFLLICQPAQLFTV